MFSVDCDTTGSDQQLDTSPFVGISHSPVFTRTDFFKCFDQNRRNFSKLADMGENFQIDEF